MLRNIVLQDFIGIWLLLTGCLVGGLIINELRPKPLPLVYAPPQARLDRSVAELGPVVRTSVALDGDVARDEIQQLSANHAALILDARPEIFYRLGHIPTALSLPREDFEKQYQNLRSTLQAHRGSPLVIYCSSYGCHDSQMVADALQKLGCGHVRIFRGGWSEWESANLPEEK